MPATRIARRKTRAKTTDPVERRLHNRQRKQEAPAGFVTRPVLCERVSLTEAQFRTLTASNVILSDGANPSGYALYSNATVERLIAMKRDGSLFRSLASAAPAAADALSSTPAIVSPTLHYSAEDGVRVFELLRDGKTLEDIILETRIHPMLVKAIRVDYDDITGSIHLTKDIVQRMNALGNDGKLPGAFPLRDANDVFAIVELCSTDRTCSTCEKNAALTSCEDCLVKERRAALAMSRSA